VFFFFFFFFPGDTVVAVGNRSLWNVRAGNPMEGKMSVIGHGYKGFAICWFLCG
jgi:hypothetical protein